MKDSGTPPRRHKAQGSRRPPRTETRARVRELHAQGLTLAEIARELGLSTPTICYHARSLGIPKQEKFSRRYDWSDVQRYYDAGHSITDCQKHFGFARKTFWDAAVRGDIITRPNGIPLDKLLVAGPKRHRGSIKVRLLSAGLKENRCEECGIADWRGKPLSMALHHVNGDGNDNRLENLKLVCPNCHSQTDNFAGRNVRRLRRARIPRGALPWSQIELVRLPVRGTAA